MSTQTMTLTRPDDWHLHLRDGKMLEQVVPATARCFRRAIVMPNLKPPVTTVAAAAEYRQRILDALPEGMTFEPLMTLYLTDNTSPDEIRRAAESGFVHAVKYYPAGATTNSDSGVTDLGHARPALEAMQDVDLPLLLHGEVTDPEIDIFDREAVFIERHLQPLVRDFPALRVVLEHVTTRDAVDFVTDAPDRVAATITVHHLLMNRNSMFVGGLRPHHYCLPIIKREEHRRALVGAATGGNPKFFLGTDSAPHPRGAKESDCGCAGVYSAPVALELYAEVFDQVDALGRLEGFASLHGPKFYRLPANRETITLSRDEWQVPDVLGTDAEPLVPLRAGQKLRWRVERG
ncbi:MAG: dihydroorotase [Ahrensia sp.]|nr:dihydroorotase [Ahrensia sp.]|tara:strand:- start:245 stop:1288 length:1044 start_codon:yes stop_codon:yes gene_type:complete